MPAKPLTDILEHALRTAAPPALCVAFSGGPDSTALLHALAPMPEARERGLRALHVDHGLHAESAGWAHRCAVFCKTLNVPLTVLHVTVRDAHGEGLEAAARRARYAAFAESLHEGEWLALAHHRDDQIETVLLKLLRGAGPEGLGGMRVLRPLASGFLWRPLLETPREILHNYLKEKEIEAIEDPANADPRFARNVLRRELLPRIRGHWPHAAASILHAARLCRTAADYIDADAQAALSNLRRDTDSLDAEGWLSLPEALHAPVLDAWLHARGLSAPPDASRAELARQAAQAAIDRVPVIAWPNAEVRVWDGRLHAMPSLTPVPARWQAQWNGAPLVLPDGCGTLMLHATNKTTTPATGVRIDPPLTVRFRRGGERIKPAGDAHTRELRDLFQQARMPPWLRERCPLIFEHGELIAVADLWISERGNTVFATPCVHPRWQRPTDTQGTSCA
ncbi:MAG: tRNA lysidine(34) synthetase TilS [Rhodanobacteraceae bacterium]|nr:MAG: tRNA lysidine(34) synthetase TilS [Rhodanobacteraceae bacterium]